MEKVIRPDQKYIKEHIWTLLLLSGILVIVIAFIHFMMHLEESGHRAIQILWIIGICTIAAMWLISYPLIKIWINNLEYIIHEDRVTIHKGILTKTKQNIPFRAITDFALQRTLFDRMLGLGSINIQTAGQSHTPTGYEGKLAGLIDYDALHKDLRDRVKVLHPIAESTTIREPQMQSEIKILEQILSELQEIRRNLEKK